MIARAMCFAAASFIAAGAWGIGVASGWTAGDPAADVVVAEDALPADGLVDGLTAEIEAFLYPDCPPSTASIVRSTPRRAEYRPPLDLRKPRPPRHRSDRPAPIEVDVGMAAVAILGRAALAMDGRGGRFAAPMSDAIPAACHRLPLLRPPAVTG